MITKAAWRLSAEADVADDDRERLGLGRERPEALGTLLPFPDGMLKGWFRQKRLVSFGPDPTESRNSETDPKAD
ncbi:hypothetical protein OIK40_11060, partial [Erythrobacter sp. sf7]